MSGREANDSAVAATWFPATKRESTFYLYSQVAAMF